VYSVIIPTINAIFAGNHVLVAPDTKCKQTYSALKKMLLELFPDKVSILKKSEYESIFLK